MASSGIGRMGEYKEELEDFDSYKERFEFWCEANGVKEEKRAVTFLSVIGPKPYQLLKDLMSPDKPREKTFEQLHTALSNHYLPQNLVIAERFRF